MGLRGSFNRCVENFDEIRILKGRNGLLNFDILRFFENWGENHKVVFFPVFVRFWV